MTVRWYVFVSKSRQEITAGESIRDLGFPVFIPTEKRIQRLPNGKPRIRENALFPRYGFVQAIPELIWEIAYIRGVIDILRHELKPIPVSDSCIDALRLAQNVGIFDHTKAPQVGMEVQITAGPFMGWIGKILRARSGDRMDVLLKFLGAECQATIPLMALKEIA